MKASAALFLLLLTACTDGSSTDGRSTDSRVEREGTGVFDPLIGTIDRAESVEDVLREGAAERNRQLE